MPNNKCNIIMGFMFLWIKWKQAISGDSVFSFSLLYNIGLQQDFNALAGTHTSEWPTLSQHNI